MYVYMCIYTYIRMRYIRKADQSMIGTRATRKRKGREGEREREREKERKREREKEKEDRRTESVAPESDRSIRD